MPKLAALLLAATSAIAAPTQALVARQATVAPGTAFCGRYDQTDPTQTYVVSNDLWDQIHAPQGTQCSELDSLSSNAVAWHSQWDWPVGTTDGDPVSFAHSALNLNNAPKQPLGKLTSVPTQVQWSYSSIDGLKADVAYDLFTAANPTPGGYSSTGDYEIMVWLSSWGGVSPKGSPIPENPFTDPKTQLTYTLYYGEDQNSKTYSYVANQPASTFDSDLNPFLQNLISPNLGQYMMPNDQCLITFQFGSEVWEAPSQMTFNVASFNGSVAY